MGGGTVPKSLTLLVFLAILLGGDKVAVAEPRPDC
jgi:hypothetical protein